jgi:hypothetical protein
MQQPRGEQGKVAASASPAIKMSEFKPFALRTAQELGGSSAEQQVEALLKSHKVNKRKEVNELLERLRQGPIASLLAASPPHLRRAGRAAGSSELGFKGKSFDAVQWGALDPPRTYCADAVRLGVDNPQLKWRDEETRERARKLSKPSTDLWERDSDWGRGAKWGRNSVATMQEVDLKEKLLRLIRKPSLLYDRVGIGRLTDSKHPAWKPSIAAFCAFAKKSIQVGDILGTYAGNFVFKSDDEIEAEEHVYAETFSDFGGQLESGLEISAR